MNSPASFTQIFYRFLNNLTPSSGLQCLNYAHCQLYLGWHPFW